MKKIFIVSLLLASIVAHGSLRSVTPALPRANMENSSWMKRHNEKMNEVANGGAPVVFIGDSITHSLDNPNGRTVWDKYFADGKYRALNLGFSGDRTEHVLWRIANGELDGYEAKAVVLMIGTNNTGHFPPEKETPEDTVVGIKAVLDAIRAKQPKAKIILCSIFPRGESPSDANRMRNDAVNEVIAKYADGKNILWCDISAKLLTEDGLLLKSTAKDFLHPATGGLEIWAQSLLPYLEFAFTAKDGEECKLPVYRAVRATDAEYASLPKAAIPTAIPNRGWWKTRMRQKREEIVDGTNEYDVVMVGDSITHRWERKGGGGERVYAELKKGYSILNLGIGGDQTQHVLWRMQNGELEGYKTKMFVLMIGTNNSHKPEDVALGIRKIIETMRDKHPESKILLHPIFPRGATANDRARIRNEKVNEIIKTYADGNVVIWHDFNNKFLDENGNMQPNLMFPDNLHPDHNGYLIWRDELLPFFKRFIRSDRSTTD